MESKVKDILLLLEQNGWSDLIDSRWEQQVREEILTTYPDIDIDTLDKVLAALGSLISLGYLFESLMITGIIYIILKIKILKWTKLKSCTGLCMKMNYVN